LASEADGMRVMHVMSEKTAPASFPPIWRKRNPNSLCKHRLYRI